MYAHASKHQSIKWYHCVIKFTTDTGFWHQPNPVCANPIPPPPPPPRLPESIQYTLMVSGGILLLWLASYVPAPMIIMYYY